MLMAKSSPRLMRFSGQWLDTPVIARHALRPGDRLTGPAIVEQLDTTTVIEPGDAAKRLRRS